MKMIRVLGRAAFLSTALMLGVSQASTYPSKPIKLIVPFAPGAGADVPARRVAIEMSKALNNQSIFIENRQGAGGIIGSEAGAKAAPDGYTLLIGTMNTHGVNAGLYKRLPYDPIKSYAPISRIAAFPNVLVVPATAGISSLKELIAQANQAKSPLTYSSTGTGTTIHLAGEMFQKAANVKLLHVPYADGSQYLPDLVAGRTDMTFGNLPQVLPFIKSGKLVPVAITTAQRSPLLPNVPTMEEAGFKDAEMSIWIGLFAPAGTPQDVVDALNAAANKALVQPSIKESFAADGMSTASDSSSADFARFLVSDVQKWIKVVKDSGIPRQ